MANNERYDAFISYRHCEPDSEIAERLHRKLESYRLPKEVAKKVGRDRLERVFRDEAELSVSDDLSEEIDAALRHSDYLICICSPQYLESEWCVREVEDFLEHNDRHHVLLVLADGEPETAFPPVMFHDGTEPLAAECKGKNSKERKAQVDKAVVRLMAAMFGVGYDDLMQRHRRQKNIRRTIRVMIAFAVMAVIMAVTMFFLVKIAEQNVIISQRYADTLAVTSSVLLEDGHRRDAIYAARRALPEQRSGSYSEAALQALVDALGIYDLPGVSCDREIKIPCYGNYYYDISPSGRYIGVVGLDRKGYLVDMEDGTILTTIALNETSVINFDGDRGIIFQKSDGNFAYVDVMSLQETNLGGKDGSVYVDDMGNGYAIVTNDKVVIYRGNDILNIFSFEGNIVDWERGHYATVSFTQDGTRAFIFFLDNEDGRTFAFSVDLMSGATDRFPLACGGLASEIKTDGNYIAWSMIEEGKSRIFLQNLDDPNNVRDIVLDTAYIQAIGISGSDLVAVTDKSIYLMNTDLVMIDQIRTSGYLSRVAYSSDGIVVYDFASGAYIINNGKYQFIGPELDEDGIHREQIYNDGVLYLLGSGEDHISTYTYRESDRLREYDGEYSELMYEDYVNDSSDEILRRVLETDPGFDENRVYAVTICAHKDLAIIQLWDGAVYIYDTVTYQCLKTIYALDGRVIYFNYDEANECYYISAKDFEVYDKDLKKMYEVENCNQIGVDKETGNPVIIQCVEDKEYKYIVEMISYEEIIQQADRVLDGYVPDDRTREKYALD